MDKHRIPYGRQDISDADVAAVVSVLRSDFLTQGRAIDRFEEELSRRCGAKFAVALANATGALHLAMLALGVKVGDRVWTSPNTFVASANCALYCGATVDFVDIDPRTYNMSVTALEAKLKHAARIGELPRVVIPVHFAGQPCDMTRIGLLAKEYGFSVVEDASHAVGGSYKGSPIGACDSSDMTIFSFHPVKIITTGEGGMITTNRPDLHERLLRLRTHGITRNPALMDAPPEGSWVYAQIDLGFNYRLTDIHAALGLSQLGRLEKFVEMRWALAERYDAALTSFPVIRPWQSPDGRSAFHLYVIQVDPSRCQRSRKQVFECLKAEGIDANVHYIPVHTQPYYRNLGFNLGDFPESEKYYANAISLPLFPGLTYADQDRVILALERALT
jgi:UDP-4-amino-4,6-dideoxy-N-acetyl-beta-L-altrosamine transaminase